MWMYAHRNAVKHREEKMLLKAKADGKEAIEADYSRIDRDLVAPIRLVRRRLRRVT